MLLAHWLLPLRNRSISSRRSRRRRKPAVPAVEQMESRVLLCAGHGLENDSLPPAAVAAAAAASDVERHRGRVDADVGLGQPSGAGRSDRDGFVSRDPGHFDGGAQFTTSSGFTANDDNYTIYLDGTEDPFDTVLENDTEVGWVEVTLETDVSNGTLLLADDGNFSYEPDPGFIGIDTFVYLATVYDEDQPVDSDTATVTINVLGIRVTSDRDDNRDPQTNGCSCSCGCDDATSPQPNTTATAGPTVNPATGGLNWDFSSLFGLAAGILPSYASLENPHPILPLDVHFPHVAPGSLHAEMTWGGLIDTPIDVPVTPEFTSETGRIALQIDASSLPTGRYPYSVELQAFWGPSKTHTVAKTGYDYVFNRSDSEFGNRWWLPGLDQLQIETGGVSILRADGSAGFFEKQPDGSFWTPDGSLTELEKNLDGTYTLHGHHGEHTLFDSSGRLTQIEDANGNVTTYTYGTGNRLTEIADPFGRTATYTYGADDKLDTVEDFQGRIFTYVHDTNGLLTSISGPDPDRNSATATRISTQSAANSSSETPLGRRSHKTAEQKYVLVVRIASILADFPSVAAFSSYASSDGPN